MLDPYLNPGLTILDAGSGCGFFSAYFCDKGLDTTAVDFSQQALTLTQARTFNRAKIICADMLADDFVSKFKHNFKIIFSDGLFEHFSSSDQDKLLDNFIKILAPHGYIITFVPNLFSPWTIIRPFLMPGIKEQPFTMKKLMTLNKRNSLKIEQSGGVNVLPWHISPEKYLANFFGMLIFTVALKD